MRKPHALLTPCPPPLVAGLDRSPIFGCPPFGAPPDSILDANQGSFTSLATVCVLPRVMACRSAGKSGTRLGCKLVTKRCKELWLWGLLKEFALVHCQHLGLCIQTEGQQRGSSTCSLIVHFMFASVSSTSACVSSVGLEAWRVTTTNLSTRDTCSTQTAAPRKRVGLQDRELSGAVCASERRDQGSPFILHLDGVESLKGEGRRERLRHKRSCSAEKGRGCWAATLQCFDSV
jgi:hypothetical protein